MTKITLSHNGLLDTDSKTLLRRILDAGPSCGGMGVAWDALDVRDKQRLCRGCPALDDCGLYGRATMAADEVYGGIALPRYGRTDSGRPDRWTEHEDQIIASSTPADAARLLPDRTDNAIRVRRGRLRATGVPMQDLRRAS